MRIKKSEATEEIYLSSLASLIEEYLITFFKTHKSHLPPNLHRTVIQEVERSLIKLTYERSEGNQKKTAEILGINRNTLRKKLQELLIITQEQV